MEYTDAEVIDTTGGDFTINKPGGAQGILVDEAAGANSDVRLVTKGGTTLTIEDVPPGTIIPLAFTQVLQTGTTADKLIALYR
jgi:hypothetical protein